MMHLAYVAGIFDGEGCVGFGRCRTAVFPRIFVSNTNRDLLEALRDQFGGDINPASNRKAGWKQGWNWRLSWTAAVEFLDKISPYLRIKNRQAHTVFAWDAIRLGSGKSTQTDKAEYLDAVGLLTERMRWLNQKGQNDAEDPIDIALRKAGKARKTKKT